MQSSGTTGGLGGTSTGGDINIPGQAGGGGVIDNDNGGTNRGRLGGQGGSSMFGAGGISPTASGNGNAGVGYGSGGSGAVNTSGSGSYTGGAGTGGLCIIKEVYL